MNKYTKLNYEGFEKYLLEVHDKFDGKRYVFGFPNHYGASVIKHFDSIGHEKDLFELAVLERWRDEWELCYDTYITDDVIGWLSNDRVLEILNQIKNL